MPQSEPFFGLSEIHVLTAMMGAAILAAYLLPRIAFRGLASSAFLLMLSGLAGFAVLPGMPDSLDPRLSPRLWAVASEVTLIVVLFATGLRIDNPGDLRRWLPTLRLLLLAMPLTILAVALLGWALAGMTLAGAILLGAVLSPTDPVLAGDVQVGPPLEGREHPVRFTLTAEAGLNDGLAFPFVHLALILATAEIGTAQGSAWLTHWLLRDVIYRIVTGAAVGALVGWLLGRAMFSSLGNSVIQKGGPGVLALGAVLLCYGLVELAEGYGFVGAFVAGLVCRRVQADHDFHRRLHGFSQAVEHALTAILLILLGGALPALWPALDWRHSLIGFGLLLVIRPMAGWIALAGAGMPNRQRGMVAFFGVRGIGSVYYIGYAAGHVELVNEDQLWALVGYTIIASALIHGATSFLVERHTGGAKGGAGVNRP